MHESADDLNEGPLPPALRRVARAVSWELADLAGQLYRSQTVSELRDVLAAIRRAERSV